MEPLCLSLHPCLSTSLCLFHAFSFPLTHHCDRIESSQLVDANKFIMDMAGEQTGLGQRRKGESCLSFFHLLICLSIYPIYLFISPLGSRLSGESEGLGICLWCVCKFVYMFKVGRFRLTRTVGPKDLGEDRWLPL